MALNGIQIFKLTPKKNCKECGCPTCMAFSMKVAQGAMKIEQCPHMSDEALASLSEATAPPMKTIKIGTGAEEHSLGGETVLFRHEKTFVSKPRYAVALCTCMDDAAVEAKLAEIPKVARWQQIAESAAKQSKRMLIPEIHEVMTYKEALAFAGHLDVKLIPYELAKGMKETREILNELRPGQSIGIFIGPEGGFEEEEVSKALEAGAHAITLGRRILRTETAGLAILSVLMFQLENE